MATNKNLIKDEKAKLAEKRLKQCAKGQGIKEGKQIGFKRGIKLSSIIASLAIMTSIAGYMGVLGIQTKSIDLVTELKNTDLGKIVITKEAKEDITEGANKEQILLALLKKNQNTIKGIDYYKVDDIKYDKDKLSGEAKVHSSNWLSKQEVKITYKVEKEHQ